MMAEKRMFAKSIVLSDAFLDMPLSARCLYFTFGMLADDDGFVGSPKAIMRQCGASQDDLAVLISKRYVLAFESGVIVIKHWRVNNYLRQDRHIQTTYIEELQSLSTDPKGAYIEADISPLGIPSDNQVTTTCQATGIPSIVENSKEENRRDLVVTNVTTCRTQDVRRVLEAWNSLGLNTVKKIIAGTDRDKWLRKRMKDYGIDDVLIAIEKVRKSKFLMGDNRNGWQATFDWFIRPNNFAKVLSGNYDDKDQQERSGSNGEHPGPTEKKWDVQLDVE